MADTPIDIEAKIKGLQLRYLERPQSELLIVMPNPYPGVYYRVNIDFAEYTSLCPFAPSQPDFAHVYIDYVPRDKIVELKSLKYYLTSYRMCRVVYEEANNSIFEDLSAALKPVELKVRMQWNIRGGTGVVTERSTTG